MAPLDLVRRLLRGFALAGVLMSAASLHVGATQAASEPSLDDPDPHRRLAAATALVARGEIRAALPVLVAGASAEDRVVRRESIRQLSRAAEASETETAPAAPVLGRALRDRDTGVASFAQDALFHLGRSGIPTLVEALRDEQPVRERAYVTLGRIDETTRLAAVPLLIETSRIDELTTTIVQQLGARTPNQSVATWTSACVLLGHSGSAAVPALLDALRDRAAPVRLCAATALLDMGGPLASVSGLEQCASDIDPEVQHVARAALERRKKR